MTGPGTGWCTRVSILSLCVWAICLAALICAGVSGLVVWISQPVVKTGIPSC